VVFEFVEASSCDGHLDFHASIWRTSYRCSTYNFLPIPFGILILKSKGCYMTQRKRQPETDQKSKSSKLLSLGIEYVVKKARLRCSLLTWNESRRNLHRYIGTLMISISPTGNIADYFVTTSLRQLLTNCP
jgi:hypothetical protein